MVNPQSKGRTSRYAFFLVWVFSAPWVPSGSSVEQLRSPGYVITLGRLKSRGDTRLLCSSLFFLIPTSAGR